MQNQNPNPTLYEVAETLAENIGRFIELQYERLFPRRVLAEVLYSEPETAFKGFTGEDQGEVFHSKKGAILFRTRFLTRRDAQSKEYCWRSLRLEGIRLDTVLVGNGPNGKVRAFPNVPQDFKARA
jgi:hypothetical protein